MHASKIQTYLKNCNFKNCLIKNKRLHVPFIQNKEKSKLIPRIKIDEESIATCPVDKRSVRAINFNLNSLHVIFRLSRDRRKQIHKNEID